MDEYWNHNTAYHDWILRTAAERPRDHALDVGCGDGLLLQRLAPFVGQATGLEPDPPTFEHARTRLRDTPNAVVEPEDFASYPAGAEKFDLITFVASLHHADLHDCLRTARGLLRPGGDVLIVGLAAHTTAADWLLSALAVPVVRVSSALHRETADIGVPTAPPRESLADIRAAARAILPGATIRRGLYYRYLLRWTKPGR